MTQPPKQKKNERLSDLKKGDVFKCNVITFGDGRKRIISSHGNFNTILTCAGVACYPDPWITSMSVFDYVDSLEQGQIRVYAGLNADIKIVSKKSSKNANRLSQKKP